MKKFILYLIAGTFGLMVLGAVFNSLGMGSEPVADTENVVDSIPAADEAVADNSIQGVTCWRTITKKDEMTDKDKVWVNLVSRNSHNFAFPYDGGSTLTICVRHMKKNDVLLTLSKGQVLCSEYSGTDKVTVRFDDGKPMTFKTNEPSDGSSDFVFVRDAQTFIKHAKTAKTIKIQIPVYQEGSPVFEFETTEPLVWNY